MARCWRADRRCCRAQRPGAPHTELQVEAHHAQVRRRCSAGARQRSQPQCVRVLALSRTRAPLTLAPPSVLALAPVLAHYPGCCKRQRRRIRHSCRTSSPRQFQLPILLPLERLASLFLLLASRCRGARAVASTTRALHHCILLALFALPTLLERLTNASLRRAPQLALSQALPLTGSRKRCRVLRPPLPPRRRSLKMALLGVLAPLLQRRLLAVVIQLRQLRRGHRLGDCRSWSRQGLHLGPRIRPHLCEQMLGLDERGLPWRVEGEARSERGPCDRRPWQRLGRINRLQRLASCQRLQQRRVEERRLARGSSAGALLQDRPRRRLALRKVDVGARPTHDSFWMKRS